MHMLGKNSLVQLSQLRLSFIWLAACNVGGLSLIPRFRRSPGGGHGNPLQYSCLENPKDGGACWAAFHGVTKSQMWLRDQEQQQVDKASLKTSKGVSFLTLSDVYIRSFLCPFYTIIKPCCTKAPSDQASFLTPDRNSLLRRQRIPASFTATLQSQIKIQESQDTSNFYIQNVIYLKQSSKLQTKALYIFCSSPITIC